MNAKGWLILILILSLLTACSGGSLEDFARQGFVIQVVEATAGDLALIQNGWSVHDLVETRAYRMEHEISYEFTIEDGKDLRNIEHIRTLFLGIREQNGRKTLSFIPFQDKHLIDFIDQKNGQLTLRIYVGKKLKHHETYDLLVDDHTTTVNSLLVK